MGWGLGEGDHKARMAFKGDIVSCSTPGSLEALVLIVAVLARALQTTFSKAEKGILATPPPEIVDPVAIIGVAWGPPFRGSVSSYCC